MTLATIGLASCGWGVAGLFAVARALLALDFEDARWIFWLYAPLRLSALEY